MEKDELLASILNYNAQVLGLKNIKVFAGSAEDALTELSGDFDLIYTDPDRRTEQGSRVVRFSDSQPRLDQLMPELRKSPSAARLRFKSINVVAISSGLNVVLR